MVAPGHDGRVAELPSPGPLIGRHVRLDAFGDGDVDEMFPLLADPAIYASGYVMHRRPATPADSRDLVRERFMIGQDEVDGRGAGRTVYAVRLACDSELGAAGTLVGTSSLVEADLRHERIHLGNTLYGRRWWGGPVNPETKLLMLRHCFEDVGYGRVKIQTDVRNTRSAAAIARLGAVREGVARREQRRDDGTFRDSVVFSILREEWPAVRAGLQARLAG